MFNYKEDYLNQQVGIGGKNINQSGCLEVVITSATLLKIKDSKSEALTLALEDLEERKAKINIWYKNKQGETVEFQEKHITYLIDLLGINPKMVKIIEDRETGKEFVPIFHNKIIGIILEFQGTETYIGNDGNEYKRYNYNLKGFYDVSTQRTAEEIKNNKEPKTYNYWKERFEKENEKLENEQNKKQNSSKQENNDEDDDDFPF